MQIKSIYTNKDGRVWDIFYYEELDPMQNLEGKVLQGVHAYCFYKNKMVLVKQPRSGWMPPGGHIEEGETIEETVVREVKEETNMKVLHQELIGFNDFYEPDRIVRQTRSFCIVEPYGDFISDPGEDITEIKLIDPKDYKQYFDWGEIGDRLVERALEILNKYNEKTS